MTASDTRIVSDMLRAVDDRDSDRVLKLLGEHSVTRSSLGRVYVGHAGFEKWCREAAATTTSRHFEAAKVRGLGDGYVLVVGAEHRDPVRGTAEAIPGAWLYLVVAERVHACIYFRTEQDAIASIAGPGRNETPTEVLERSVDAFNRDDYDALMDTLDEGFRFRPLLSEHAILKEGHADFTDALIWVRVRYDDVLIEGIEVDEIGEGYVIAMTTVRVVDNHGLERRRLANAVRVVDGKLCEWLSFERIESARVAVASHFGAGS